MIHTSQIKQYNELMALCAAGDDTFYSQDFEANTEENTIYRIFNYRMASYTDFLKPSALSCRGIMFEVCLTEDKPIRLASRPMDKFFNYNETPFTMYDDVSALLVHINGQFEKADGSLISSYLDIDGYSAKLKSKGSIKSDHCIAAMEWLEDFTHPEFGCQRQKLYDNVALLTQSGFTVNMEWCSPVHRIVLPYEVEHLKVLNVRNNVTGEYLDLKLDIRPNYPTLAANWVDERYSLDIKYDRDAMDFDDAFTNIKADTGIEGYVIRIEPDFVPEGMAQFFKVKTDWYIEQHHCKDSINNDRRLFECVLSGSSDDLRQMFDTDIIALKKIDDFEKRIFAQYNTLVANVERFYNENKHLARKEYAINGQILLNKQHHEFGLAMALYSGNTLDCKEHMKKRYKDFGYNGI